MSRCKHGHPLTSVLQCQECKKAFPNLAVEKASMASDEDKPFKHVQFIGDVSSKPSNPKDTLGILKAPASVVPATVITEVGLGMLEGAMKYGRHNYRVIGVRASVYYDATRRHLDLFWEGEDIDPDSELSHITKAITSLVVLRDAMIQEMWVDDRPPPAPKGWMARMNDHVKKLMAKYPNPVAPYTNKG